MTDFSAYPELLAVQPMLSSPDPAIRRVGLLQIVDLADEVPEPFVAAAGDEDAGVRLEAAKALEGNANPEAIRALARLLDDPDAEVADNAALSLGEILDPAAGPVLLQLLREAGGEARGALLGALRKLRYPPVLADAVALAGDASPAVRREAVGVLAYLKDASVVPALLRRVREDDDPEIRRMAVGALVFAAHPDVAATVGLALADEDWQVRQEAAGTLGKLKCLESIPGLIKALDDAAWEVRLKAANALGGVRAAAALPALIANLAHPISNVRKEVANALGAIGDPGAIAALRDALEADRDIEVRKAAQRALEALGG
ncbi:MAG: HEAT repeat domain-containing protein [Actinomycetota bacterium]